MKKKQALRHITTIRKLLKQLDAGLKGARYCDGYGCSTILDIIDDQLSDIVWDITQDDVVPSCHTCKYSTLYGEAREPYCALQDDFLKSWDINYFCKRYSQEAITKEGKE